MRAWFPLWIGLLLWSCAVAGAPATPPTLLIVGDSLSAAYNIAPAESWVTLLERRLQQSKRLAPTRVVNASISGETTAGALAHLPRLLADIKPSLVVVELGANDGLRGLPLGEIEANLTRIVTLCRDTGTRVLLVGIELPVNYGPQYRDALRKIYRDLAQQFKLPLVPFLLEGIALDPGLMQDDGLHPNAAGEPRVLENVWPVLEPQL
jgi:acyl-CoA thioesterase-1